MGGGASHAGAGRFRGPGEAAVTRQANTREQRNDYRRRSRMIERIRTNGGGVDHPRFRPAGVPDAPCAKVTRIGDEPIAF